MLLCFAASFALRSRTTPVQFFLLYDVSNGSTSLAGCIQHLHFGMGRASIHFAELVCAPPNACNSSPATSSPFPSQRCQLLPSESLRIPICQNNFSFIAYPTEGFSPQLCLTLRPLWLLHTNFSGRSGLIPFASSDGFWRPSPQL
jgi:hypothetical protein